MKLLFPLLAAAGLGLYAMNGKTASAASGQSGKTKAQQRAEWMAAIAHGKGQSYEQYVKVLNAAYKTGLFSQAEIASLQKQHSNFPKAQSGSASTTATSSPSATAASKPGASVEQQVADALATNNPVVLRALAAKIRGTHPQAAADLENVATALEKTNQTFGKPTSAPVAPAPVQTSSQVKKKKPAAAKKPAKKPASKPGTSTTPVEAGRGPAPDERKDLALQTARSLTTAKKGSEDKALVERFQRSENQKRVLEGRDDGINPDGRYGLATAYALGEYGLVPPKPLYWGKAGDWASVGKEKSAWKSWCLTNASNDPARAAEWTGASKVPA